MLREDMKKVQTLKRTLTPAEKTSNMCRLNKNNFGKMPSKQLVKKQIKALGQKSTKKVSST